MPKTKSFESVFSNAPKYDKSNLRSDFDAWPELANKVWSTTSVPQLQRSYSSVLFAGMGGSGIIGEVISDLASETDSPRIDVLKDYHLPKYYGSDTLVVAVSCSGSTEETISVISEAERRGLDICAFGSGGIIENMSNSNPRIAFVKTPMLKVPRTSFPALFYSVLRFMSQNGYLKISEDHIKDSNDCLKRVREQCLKPFIKQNGALQVARELTKSKTTIPLVYSSKRTRSIGLRFLQSLNENAKFHGFQGQLPEICHNDVVGWDLFSTSKSKRPKINPIEFVPISLCLDDDPLEVKTRFQIMEEKLLKTKSRSLRAPHLGVNYLSRVLSMLYYLDYSTYYAAISRGIDPMLTPSIDFLKTELKARHNYVGRLSV